MCEKDLIVELEIHLPSLDEQTHIVDILDCFDALTDDVVSGLPTEIEVRHSQYEFYRDRVLRF